MEHIRSVKSTLIVLSTHCKDSRAMERRGCSVLVLVLLLGTLLLAPETAALSCEPSGTITLMSGNPEMCNRGEMSNCCAVGKTYATYEYSPPVTSPTTAGTLTLNGFGGGEASCTKRFHSASERLVALSTGWFDGGARCGKTLTIHGNGRTTTATVVDECDTRAGCGAMHAYQPPCPLPDDVDASPAVWHALGVPESDDRYGMMRITWSQNN